MLPILLTSSSCFGFLLHFDLIALLIHLSFCLGLGAWVGELGRRKGWVGAGFVAACVSGVGLGGGGAAWSIAKYVEALVFGVACKSLNPCTLDY